MAKSSVESPERAMKIETAETQTPGAIPEGMSPQEFLNDEHLAGFYERQVTAADSSDPALPDLMRAASAARRGAAAVAANIADQAAMDELVKTMVAGGMDEMQAVAKVYGFEGEEGETPDE